MSKLTDEQIQEIAPKHMVTCYHPSRYLLQSTTFARAIEAKATESLHRRIAEFVAALDEEMVVSHLGVFNPGDDPKKAIKDLMLWSQGVGEYFAGEKAKERIAELERQLEEARNQALEEAARCCDAEEKRGQHNMTCDIPKNYEFWNGGAMFAGQLAEEIRALKGAKE